MKYAWLLVLSFLTMATGFSCRNISTAKSEIKKEEGMAKRDETVAFSEVRRINRNIQMSEYMIISDFSEMVKLYSKLDDRKFSRSEPIPTLSDNEFFLILKPKLEKEQYGDIEVTKIDKNGTVLNVYYKEITNNEYLLNQQSNPILIVRVTGIIPTDVKLLLQKN